MTEQLVSYKETQMTLLKDLEQFKREKEALVKSKVINLARMPPLSD